MKELGIILIPFLAAITALVWPKESSRRWLLPAAALGHASLALWIALTPPGPPSQPLLAVDAVTRATLPSISLLFLLCSFYGVSYLKLRAERPNRTFVAALLMLMALISLSLQAQHLGLLWVAVEGATLATVPLLHFNATPRAFEATWKYLLVGGTGVALSLLGSFFLGYASLHSPAGGVLTFSGLTAAGSELSQPWVLSAWVLLLAGYGTKMGLAPMHTWKPDAYGEAPGMVGALLAGGVTTVAFVALLRVRVIVESAGLGQMAAITLGMLGLFSMAVAALFLLGTPDYKRMLAYSSVEHMGMLSVGAALGAPGISAALFHVWSNSLSKGALFLSAGNLQRAVGARSTDKVAGMAWITPASARLFIAGMFAVTACPPFAPFFSELRIVKAALQEQQYLIATTFLVCMLLAFLDITRLVFAITDGRPKPSMKVSLAGEHRGTLLPPFLLLVASLCLGLFTPKFLQEIWEAAARTLSTF